MSRPNIAIVGATGAVGREILKILEQRKFPIGSIALLASKRSAGKQILFRGKRIRVSDLDQFDFKGTDIVLSSAGGSISKKFAARAVKAGAVIVDNTSAFRMDKNVPLVIPEINPEEIKKHKGIIANPNCSTIIALTALYGLEKKNKIKRMIVSTYQAVSGAGAAAMEELRKQSLEYLQGKKITKNIFPVQSAFNVFSHNSAVDLSNGHNEEEIKMVKETKKIFKRNDIKIAVTCVRVPVFRAHSESILVEFSSPMNPAKAKAILKKTAGVKIVDDQKNNRFPMPIDATNGDDILVGRIRQDLNSNKALQLFVSGDQIRKGAALNAVQIAERLISRK
ncbi:MAG: aspartate-semialdehyde dehydrogenase [Candidatus Omnitrophica bacterium]|nr:aspartate-semialdehyde dehydrogenase [Candidatus Omnitrophota bacterium]